MTVSTDTGSRSAQVGGDLVITDITKLFGAFLAVDDISLTIPQGSFFALLGPSGCGKTTTLRMIAGLEEPTEGSIFIGRNDITFTKPYRRPVNTVFQSYALFPHLDVAENVAFGLRRRREKDIDKRVADALELVELSALARRKPGQLSGGQQQRVALARAIVNRPEVLLLDEPLGALDLKLRRQMQIELKRIQTEVGITFVHVTHDQEEAMTMADTIAVMNSGKVEQLGTPAELYESPNTAFVANFLGQSNLIRGRLAPGGSAGAMAKLEIEGQQIQIPSERLRSGSTEVVAGIRPEKIQLLTADDEVNQSGNLLSGGVVSDASFTGVSTQYLVRMPWGQEITVFRQNTGVRNNTGVAEVVAVGTPVRLSWEPQHTFGLDGAEDVEAGAEVDPEVTAGG
jgi:spermidine/putrescine transport system ATP-binding protein